MGECAPGTETCDASGRWGACVGATGPAAEICDARDDDCDGATDEDDVCPRFPPTGLHLRHDHAEQLGRLWQPRDAVESPVPASCR